MGDGIFAAWASLLRKAPEPPSPSERRALDRIARALALRNAPPNFYQGYFFAQVTSAAGHPALRARQAETRRVLMASQVGAGPLAGSWDPGDRWSPVGGRLYSTLLATLSLEAEKGVHGPIRSFREPSLRCCRFLK